MFWLPLPPSVRAGRKSSRTEEEEKEKERGVHTKQGETMGEGQCGDYGRRKSYKIKKVKRFLKLGSQEQSG